MSNDEKEADAPVIETIESPTNLGAEDAAAVKGGAGVVESLGVKYIKYTDVDLKAAR